MDFGRTIQVEVWCAMAILLLRHKFFFSFDYFFFLDIRTLQCILLKLSLLLGVSVFSGTTFQGLAAPTHRSFLGLLFRKQGTSRLDCLSSHHTIVSIFFVLFKLSMPEFSRKVSDITDDIMLTFTLIVTFMPVAVAIKK